MTLNYPTTLRDDTVENYHGTQVADPYRWLEDPDSDATKAWVKEQVNLTDSFLSKCDTKDKVRERFTEMYNFEKFSSPFRKGDTYYQYRNDGLQNQFVLYKKKGYSSDDGDEVLIDPNTIREDGTASLGGVYFSESGKLAAYGVSLSGSDWRTFYVKDTSTCQDLKDTVDFVKFSGISWLHDDSGFFYSRFPPAANDDKGTETSGCEHHKLYFHKLGTDQSEDVLIFETPDQPKWMVGGEVTDDGKTLLITLSDSCDPVNRLYTMDISSGIESRGQVAKIVDNFDAAYDYITNEGENYWFYTNLNAPKYKVVKMTLDKPTPEHWTEVIPQKDDPLQGVRIVNNNMLILDYLKDVKSFVELTTTEGEHIMELPLPTLGSVGGVSCEKKHTEFFFSFTSFLHPGTVFRFDCTTKSVEKIRDTVVKGYDPDIFQTEQVFYPSKDGTKIPMFIISNKDMEKNGDNPALLYGYGGFSISLTPSFSVSRILFVRHFKGILAIPNLRGGDEYGEEWHKQGQKEKKQNVFDDFQCAAEFLIDNKYTQPSKITIQGGSNGGLLVGACANQRPDLYKCVIAQVGVMDMLRFHKFTIGHAWCSDYGSSDDAEGFGYLFKYSPLHNVRKIEKEGVQFPAILSCTADHDDRVVPLHSFKHISEVQHVHANQPYQSNPLLIRIELKAGHGAGKPTSKIIDEVADKFAFMAKTVGIEWVE